MPTTIVLGSGRSGLAATELLRSQKQSVLVLDEATPAIQTKKKIALLGAELITGSDISSSLCLDDVAKVIISPGVPLDHPLLLRTQTLSIPTVSETEYALSLFEGNLIGITGTNGKSTTASMIYFLLEKNGVQVELGGNIGTPVSEIILRDYSKSIEWLVLELSSYQLEQSHGLKLDAAIFLNLSPDHLERHKTMENYLKQKGKIFSGMPRGSHAFILSELQEQIEHHQFVDPSIQVTYIDPEDANKLPASKKPKLRSWQDRLNAIFSIALVNTLFKISKDTLSRQIEQFSGLPHRFECFGTLRGVRVINDSKSTNVDSTITALKNQTLPTVLMLGGLGKGERYDRLLAYRCIIAEILAFGREASRICQDLETLNPIQFPNLHEAMNKLPAIISKRFEPTVLLFSPGCASFDEFKDFEDRGDFFKNKIRACAEYESD